MKKVKIKKIKIENFQGIARREIDFYCNTVISGRNESGKTTIASAFLWVLFNKDSEWKTDFAVKPNKSGSDTQSTVTIDLDVSGESVQLKKVRYEKWTKRRGDLEKTFTGHTVEYFVDGVPKREKEFKAAVNDICPEKIFKLLSAPNYFTEVLPWKKQREMLSEMSGGVSDEDVLDHELAMVPEILDGKDVDDRILIIKATQKKINEQIKSIPARINELSRTKPDYDVDALESNISILIKDREKLTADPAGARRISELKRRLVEIETAYAEKNNACLKEVREKRAAIEEYIAKIRDKNRAIISEKDDIELKIKAAESEVYSRTNIIAALTEDKKAIAEAVFSGDKICPACGQDLPEDEVVSAKEKFNSGRAAAMADISNKIDKHQDEIDRLVKEAAFYRGKKFPDTFDTADLERKLESITFTEKDFHDDDEYVKILAEIDAVPVTDFSAEIERINYRIKEMRAKIAEIDAFKANVKRIDELRSEARALSKEHGKLSGDLFLIEKYTKKKMRMVEEKVNAMFRIVRFAMFETQINGGIKNICEARVGGTGYFRGLNGAGRINAGLDIINAMSRYHDVSVPVFIDNAESVNKLMDTYGQQISLVVTLDDFKVSERGENG